MSPCEKAAGDSEEDSPRASGRVDDVSNTQQMQKWKNGKKKRKYRRIKKRVTVKIEDTGEDVNSERRRDVKADARVDELTTKHVISTVKCTRNFLPPAPPPSPERPGDVCVVVNTSDLQISCCVVRMYTVNSRDRLRAPGAIIWSLTIKLFGPEQ